MPTGDGLLVRFLPVETMTLAAMSGLCAAARAHGNGIIEITSRGSVQLRGLSEKSAPQCDAAIAALGIAAAEGIPLHCSPLAGLDAEELLDAHMAAGELRGALARRSLARRLSPKISVVLDGGGALGLADLVADIRLRAEEHTGEVVFRVGIGGDDESAADLGIVRAVDGAATVERLLDVIARRGNMVRARELLARDGAAAFHAALSSCPALYCGSAPDGQGRGTDAIGGRYRLKDGSLACGVGLAFGHTDADTLGRLIDAARAVGAQGARAAPGRLLLIIGLSPQTVHQFIGAAEQLGFIVRADDPRRRVVACAGAPICASAHIASRALAPRIAEQMAQSGDESTVHISGCAKGCARAAAAALTIVGTANGCALIADGSVRDAPFATVAVNGLPRAVSDFTRHRRREAAHV
jgi:precorrin-3B synthase